MLVSQYQFAHRLARRCEDFLAVALPAGLNIRDCYFGYSPCSILGAGTFRNWQLATREHVAGKYTPNHVGLERCYLDLPRTPSSWVHIMARAGALKLTPYAGAVLTVSECFWQITQFSSPSPNTVPREHNLQPIETLLETIRTIFIY
jgi:hypothetical protein